MRKFRADKEIGEPDLGPDSPMVFSLVRKAISSREEPLHDESSYLSTWQCAPAVHTAR